MPNNPNSPYQNEQNGVQKFILWAGAIIIALGWYGAGELTSDILWFAALVYVAWLVAGNFVRIATVFPAWVLGKTTQALESILGDTVALGSSLPKFLKWALMFFGAWALLFGVKGMAFEKMKAATYGVVMCTQSADQLACMRSFNIEFWTLADSAMDYAVNVWTFLASVGILAWLSISHWRKKRSTGEREDKKTQSDGFEYDEARFNGGAKSEAYGSDKRHADDAKFWAFVDDPNASENERAVALKKVMAREARRKSDSQTDIESNDDAVARAKAGADPRHANFKI